MSQQEKEEKPKDLQVDTPEDNLAWICPQCGLQNRNISWQCFACYTRYRPNKENVKIPKLMKSLMKEKATKGYIYKDVEVPEPKEGELLIKTYCVGICGSDISLYNWTKEAETFAKIPFTPGHEVVGMVVKNGSNTKFKIGQRVAIENHFYCGECYQCQHGRGDICSNMSQLGHGKGTIYGGCSEYFIVPEKYCFKLFTNISWMDAVLLEPLGVAHNACERCEPNNQNVLIIGCGTIGLFAIAVAKYMGAKNIIACDVVEWKLNIAKEMGANYIINSNNMDIKTLKEELLKLTNQVGLDRIIECSGNSDMVNNSFSFLRKGGLIVLVGLPKKPLYVENVLQDIIFKSITLRTIHGRRIFHTWKMTEKLLSQKIINTKPIITHVCSLSKFEEGYEALMSGKALKVVFDLTQS